MDEHRRATNQFWRSACQRDGSRFCGPRPGARVREFALRPRPAEQMYLPGWLRPGAGPRASGPPCREASPSNCASAERAFELPAVWQDVLPTRGPPPSHRYAARRRCPTTRLPQMPTNIPQEKRYAGAFGRRALFQHARAVCPEELGSRRCFGLSSCASVAPGTQYRTTLQIVEECFFNTADGAAERIACCAWSPPLASCGAGLLVSTRRRPDRTRHPCAEGDPHGCTRLRQNVQAKARGNLGAHVGRSVLTA